MTIFKTFLKILNKNKGIVILYSVILIFFAGFNLQTNDNTMQFEKEKPSIFIINHDPENTFTKEFVTYLKNNSEVVELEETKEAISDALFYRSVNTIIIIPESFGENFRNQKNPEIEIKCTGTYESELTKMMIARYFNVAKVFFSISLTEENFDKIKEIVEKEMKIEMTSKLNTQELKRVANYYNFANYSILAGCVYVICLILSSFKKENIKKRTIISSINEKNYNRILLIANSLFAMLLWFFYCFISFFLIGDIMFTKQGVGCMINSFVFTFCAVTISFFISNVLTNKNAINGVVNVLALGSSFLCGAFVPTELLPESVQKIAHFFPSYYFINNNEKITSLENWSLTNLTPILTNLMILLGFSFIFILFNNFLSKKRRKLS